MSSSIATPRTGASWPCTSWADNAARPRLRDHDRSTARLAADQAAVDSAMLLAEALLLRSWGIAASLLVFAAGNGVYFPLVEEPGLRQRFGEA